MELDKKYWENTYLNNHTGWDIGYVATPLKEYFDQIDDKSIKILIPGAGNAYEVEYLHQKGFKNVYLLDFAPTPIQNFYKRNPTFPKNHILEEDFFKHKNNYDLIVEHTFLTSFPVKLRSEYVLKMHELLHNKGNLIGLLFNHEFPHDHPPFGGTADEYLKMFSPYFNINIFETAYNSIKPRQNRELFIHLSKK